MKKREIFMYILRFLNENKMMAGKNGENSMYLHVYIFTSNAPDTKTKSMLEHCSVRNPAEL